MLPPQIAAAPATQTKVEYESIWTVPCRLAIHPPPSHFFFAEFSIPAPQRREGRVNVPEMGARAAACSRRKPLAAADRLKAVGEAICRNLQIDRLAGRNAQSGHFGMSLDGKIGIIGVL